MDGITVFQLKSHIEKYYQALKRKLKDRTYQSQPVKRAPIPKPDGSTRYLGISCAIGLYNRLSSLRSNTIRKDIVLWRIVI